MCRVKSCRNRMKLNETEQMLDACSLSSDSDTVSPCAPLELPHVSNTGKYSKTYGLGGRDKKTEVVCHLWRLKKNIPCVEILTGDVSAEDLNFYETF
eukprot:gene2079-biopygen11276